MKNRPVKSLLPLAMAGSLAVTLGWSNDSHACAAEPFISSVCIMAIPWTNLSGYSPANGAMMSISTNQALFSLIGTTYGGNGTTTFQLPDLRGRVVIGTNNNTGIGLPLYNTGDKGGSPTVTLTAANVPLVAHSHPITTGTGGVTVTTGVGSLSANTTLSGLSATTTLNGVTATAAGSGLTLNAATTAGGTGTPNGAALASTGLTKIYATVTPNVAMAAGSISGNAPVTFTGNPTTTITGTPTTTLSGAPAVSLSGTTGVAGANSSSPVNTLPPYLAMNYFIATTGIYPSRD